MADPGQLLIATHGADSGHWYDAKTGAPAYTIVSKSGTERPTTLRDARKLGLVPGVTTLIKLAANPSLLNYIKKQVLLAALTLPKIDGEAEDDWVDRVMADADEHRIKAAERGTLIHAWIQQGFEGKPLPEDGEIYFHAAQAALAVGGIAGPWKCETTFARDGYGGKLDLWRPSWYLLDVKTTDKPLSGLSLFDDHYMQTAAYRRGVDDPLVHCGILFISTKDVAARLMMITEEQLQRGWAMFEKLLGYYYAKTGLTDAHP